MNEGELAQRFLARANPPSILHRYRRPTEWTLAEVSKCEIYAARPDELNDPFECSAPVTWNVELARQRFIEEFAPAHGILPENAANEFDSSVEWGMRELSAAFKQAVSQTGVVCLSAKPNSIRMWSYYAQAHEGICIGYDTKIRPFNVALEVKYQNPNTPFDVFASLKFDPTEIAAHITLRKAEEWKFEEEYRIPANIGNNPRLIPFHPSAIKEIRFGTRIESAFKANVMEAIAHLPLRPKLVQMRCDFDRFILTETII